MIYDDYTKDMDINSPASVIEYLRRGIYEANQTAQPHHPALSIVMTPISAKTLLEYIAKIEDENKRLQEQLATVN